MTASAERRGGAYCSETKHFPVRKAYALCVGKKLTPKYGQIQPYLNTRMSLQTAGLACNRSEARERNMFLALCFQNVNRLLPILLL